MEAKTLYSNADIDLTTAAVLPVEITSLASSTASNGQDTSSSSPSSREVNRVSWQTAALFLAPGEALRTLLFLGDRSGTLRSLRVTIERTATTVGYQETHLCTVESHRTVALGSQTTSSNAEAGPEHTATGVSASAVTFLSVSPYAPFMVVAVVGGALRALSALSFDLANEAYWRDCTAVAKTTSISLACDAMDQDDAVTQQEHRVAVVTRSKDVTLLTFTATKAVSRDPFSPPDGVRSIAWVRSLIVVGGNNGVLYTYDAPSQQLRSQTPTISFSGVLPSNLSPAQLPVLHYLAPATTNAIVHGTTDHDDAARLPHRLAWGSSFLVSKSGGAGAGAKRVLCVAEVPASDVVSGTDVGNVVSAATSDAAHALPVPSSVMDVTCLAPFLLGHTKAGLILLGVCDGEKWVAGGRNSTTFDTTDVRCVLPMPMGALALSSHTVQAHVLLPFAAQLDLLIRSKQYCKAEWFFLHYAPQESQGGQSSSTPSGLQHFYQTAAVHAWEAGEYGEAFVLFEKAHTPLDALLALFPELRLPSQEAQHTDGPDSAGGALLDDGTATTTTDAVSAELPRFTTCPSAEPYERLYRLLKQTLFAWDAGDDACGASLGASAAHTEAERAQLEYALFLLIAFLSHEKPAAMTVPLSEAAAVLLQCRALPMAWCVQLLDKRASSRQTGLESSLGLSTRRASPRDFLPFLYASCGELETALDVCQADGAVDSAGWVLRSAAVPTDALYTTHLPWMLARDAAHTASLLTAPHVCPPAIPTIVALLTGCPTEREVLLEYLHHCVYEAESARGSGGADRSVQTAYALHLIELIHQMQDALKLEGLSAAGVTFSPGSESGFLGVCRRLLLAFLDDAGANYDATVVLARLHACRLFSEKVKVQAHMRDHVGVLETLVYDLGLVDDAILYCRGVPCSANAVQPLRDEAMTEDELAASSLSPTPFKPVTMAGIEEGNRTDTPVAAAASTQQPAAASAKSNPLLLILLQLLLVPPSEDAPPRMADALHLLATHARFLNPLAVLDSLPGEMPMSDIEPYLLRCFQTLELATELVELEAAATMSAVESARRAHVRLEQRCAWVMEARACAVCHEPLSESCAHWVLPNLKVTHLHCLKNTHADPERHTPFRVPPHLPLL